MVTKRVKQREVKVPVTPEALEELSFLRGEDWEQTRELAKEDLWVFMTQVLWPDKVDQHYQESFHRPIAEWIDTSAPNTRKLLLMPRKHRKTYIATIAHVIWRIVRDPNIRIIVVSALDDTAKVFLQVIKRQFQYNKTLRHYFPEFAVEPNSQFGTTYEFTHPKRTDYSLIDPTLRATYLGAPLAGRRCDILIYDDPIEKKHVATPEQADKALRNFNDLIPVVDDSPHYHMIFVIGTRWGFNDIYGAILGEDRGDEARATFEDESKYDAIVRHCLENEEGDPDFESGEPIFDKLYTRSKLLAMLDDYRKDPKQGEEDWWKQMMNVCQSPKGKKFYEEWFDTWVKYLPSNIVWSGIVVDSATKDEQIVMQGDFTGVLVGHFDAYGHLYLTDGARSDAWKSPELMSELRAMTQRNNGVSNIVKEKVGEEMFFGMVRSEYNRNRMPITTYALNVRGQGKKVVRIVEAVQQPAMARHIHFVEGFPKHIHKALVDELIHIGQWSHDDLADALSLFFHSQIRIRPAQHSSHPWKTPHRITQRSTARLNPAAVGHVGWKTRQPGAEIDAGDGTSRKDPFLAQRGNVESIDIAKLNK